ncbi:hypothetical protein F7P85_11185 [Kerstersia gyiorum]|nr:hypothetical protein F7P85_11185 [Kerstersia gyiorum]
MRSGSRARVHKERLRAQDDGDKRPAGERAPRERRDGEFSQRPRRDGDFQSRPRREGEFQPRERREGGFVPRERREGEFSQRPRRDGDFQSRPRREGEFQPRERREGGFVPRERREGEFSQRPRRDGDFQSRPRREGEFQPRERREGSFVPRERREGDFSQRPRRDGDFQSRPRREGEFQPRERREGSFVPRGRREGDFSQRPRRDGDFQSRPRREGEFQPRERREGSFVPRERREGDFSQRPRRDVDFQSRPRREGESQPRDRREGGFQGREQRDHGFQPRNSTIGAGASARESAVFKIFASCPQGLEAALEAELQALDFVEVRQGRAGCHFESDWRGVMRANLYSRLATRILIQLAQAPVQTEDDILALAVDTEWEQWFGPEHRLRVDTSAIRSPMQSLQYCNLRVKDGICDRLRAREGARPDIDTVRPDARVHLFLSEDTATLYLDTSGESLFKRGWRYDKGAAPLRENLAAGLLALSDWDPAAALLDPFCGSGTILIEAAWIALGVPPGMNRPFGFERLRDYDAYQLGQLRQEAQAAILPSLDAPLVGVDLDPAVIAAARSNAERARLSPDAIRFEVGDARHFAPPADSGWIVTNPPYGERLDEHEDALWQEWATHLKHSYAGWRLNVISNDMSLPQALRLKASRRQPVFNGSLECRLFSFDLVEGSNRS